MRPLLALILALSWTSHIVAEETKSLTQSFGHVAPFTLTDQNGQAFSPEQLRGKIWVAHFFFTTCTQGCDKTVDFMRKLQDKFRGKRDVAFVSISVNPDIDRPELLADYARDMGAEPGQWYFLTGPRDAVYETVHQSFRQAALFEPKSKSIVHSFNVVIVDREGNTAGYIDALDPTHRPPLESRIRSLARERYRLPAVNALLNGTAAVLLVVGFLAIRARREKLHKVAMLTAVVTSAVFLASYLYFHFVVMDAKPTRFAGPEPVRVVYLAILLSHTVLAVVVTPLVLYVTYQGLRDARPRHVRVARWTLPIWLYVSVTGVVVYAILYLLYPPY